MHRITDQKLLFFSHGVLYVKGVKTTIGLWSFLIIFTTDHSNKQPLWTENLKITGLKDCKNYQENISLSLANKKMDEKNEWKFSNQSGESCILHIPYSSQTLKKLLFFGSLSRVRCYDS